MVDLEFLCWKPGQKSRLVCSTHSVRVRVASSSATYDGETQTILPRLRKDFESQAYRCNHFETGPSQFSERCERTEPNIEKDHQCVFVEYGNSLPFSYIAPMRLSHTEGAGGSTPPEDMLHPSKIFLIREQGRDRPSTERNVTAIRAKSREYLEIISSRKVEIRFEFESDCNVFPGSPIEFQQESESQWYWDTYHKYNIAERARLSQPDFQQVCGQAERWRSNGDGEREAGKRVRNPEIESGPQARTDSTAATNGLRASEERKMARGVAHLGTDRLPTLAQAPHDWVTFARTLSESALASHSCAFLSIPLPIPGSHME
ncbi:hypothetical protein B0H11DRAFT_1928172 [Mycena galericulata]|nr:hypothetical protein B0H11DRAFT_1928172 [Mycena galericulata]